MKRLAFAAVAAVGFVPIAATAQDYIHLFSGVNSNQDATFSGQIGGAPQTVETEFDNDLNLGLAYGRNFGTFRGEIELSTGTGDADFIDFSGNGAGAEANTAGSLRQTRLFANVLYDFASFGSITPYVGAGAGAVFVDQDHLSLMSDSSCLLSVTLVLWFPLFLSD